MPALLQLKPQSQIQFVPWGNPRVLSNKFQRAMRNRYARRLRTPQPQDNSEYQNQQDSHATRTRPHLLFDAQFASFAPTVSKPTATRPSPCNFFLAEVRESAVIPAGRFGIPQ
jgi:hypothetical protein